jgi:glutamate synthase domain-containing protein 2
MNLWIGLAIIVAALAAVVVYDVLQKRRAILHNFPIIGHFRYILEAVGPELRQYIVTNNDEERPFNRDQRRWVYASSKKANNYFGFGTDNDLETSSNYLIIKHAAFPYVAANGSKDETVPCAKILGDKHGRSKSFRPSSIVNVSGMSYGSLSSAAIEALNRGCEIAGCLHNTGEGGVSKFHRRGGELIWQIGTGYFGCRADDGGFSLSRFQETVAQGSIRAIEIKLSQGAKPGMGGLLPAAKVTAEIAAARGIPIGKDCASPSRHSAFSDVDSMIEFIERLADLSGLPVGIKSAVGESKFWNDLAARMKATGCGPDFITIDGGEGGTGAAPLVFSDHVALPFKTAFARVYRTFAEAGLTDEIVFIGSGRLGFPESALLAMALGCDMINVGREAMMSIGCIQAQRCHTGHCPTGVATQNSWLVRGLDPAQKSVRLANYVSTLRHEMLTLSRACGVPHPAMMLPDHFDIVDDRFGVRSVRDVFGYEEGWGLPSSDISEAVGSMPGIV